VTRARLAAAGVASPMLFRRVGRRTDSIDGRIVAQIRDLIGGGQLMPGDQLPPERELAQAFNVGRASLREALRGLAALGLIEIRWGQGVFVRQTQLDDVLERLVPLLLSPDNVADLYAVRRLLEVAAAGWAAERSTDDERAELGTLTDEAEASRARLAADPDFARDFDRRYHNLVAILSHNAVVVRIMLSLLDLLGDLRRRSFAIPGRALRSLEEHRAITAAIVAGDVESARARMLAHLDRAEAAVVAPGEEG
jgi:GntR family transcriptional repressor for pyruvate dehydrogenase complex